MALVSITVEQRGTIKKNADDNYMFEWQDMSQPVQADIKSDID
jgi:phosphoribosyl-dephospho-CoA transferase